LQALGLDSSAATVAAALAAGVLATVAVAPFEKARVKLQGNSKQQQLSGKIKKQQQQQQQQYQQQSPATTARWGGLRWGSGGGGGVTLTAGKQQQKPVKLPKKVRASDSSDGDDGGGVGMVQVLVALAADEQGWVAGLFDGVPLLLAKDIVYSVVKFLSFDAAKSAIFAFDPALREGGLSSSLLVSLAAGAVAGVFSALASQPGDTIFTLLASRENGCCSSSSSSGSKSGKIGGGSSGSSSSGNRNGKPQRGRTKGPTLPSPPSPSYGPLEALGEVLATQGPAGLYAGAVPRAVFAGSLLALEFLIYDYLRALFHVTSGDLVVALDVLGTLKQ
jgi:hypothetical protein